MKKVLLLACLLLTVSVWAAEPYTLALKDVKGQQRTYLNIMCFKAAFALQGENIPAEMGTMSMKADMSLRQHETVSAVKDGVATIITEIKNGTMSMRMTMPVTGSDVSMEMPTTDIDIPTISMESQRTSDGKVSNIKLLNAEELSNMPTSSMMFPGGNTDFSQAIFNAQLPDHPIKIGETWDYTMDFAVSPTMKFAISATNKLAALQVLDGKKLLRIESDITMTLPKTLMPTPGQGLTPVTASASTGTAVTAAYTESVEGTHPTDRTMPKVSMSMDATLHTTSFFNAAAGEFYRIVSNGLITVQFDTEQTDDNAFNGKVDMKVYGVMKKAK